MRNISVSQCQPQSAFESGAEQGMSSNSDGSSIVRVGPWEHDGQAWRRDKSARHPRGPRRQWTTERHKAREERCSGRESSDPARADDSNADAGIGRWGIGADDGGCRHGVHRSSLL